MTGGRRVPASRRGVHGRTLLELIVSMAISVTVLLGISIYYGTASQTARVSHQMSSMNEEAPLAMLMIGQAIKRAGYGEIVGTGYVNFNQTLFDGPHLRACRGGQFANPAAGDFSCVAAAGAQDTLLVRFQANSVVAPGQVDTRNCAGAPAALTPITTPGHVALGLDVPIVQNVYRVAAGRLDCAGNGAVEETLAHDVVEFRIYFGFDEEAANLASAGGFGAAPRGSTLVTADQIIAREAAFGGTQMSAWDFVVSVHACLVMRTRSAGTSVVGGGFAYTGCPDSPTDVANGTGPPRTGANGTVHRTYLQVFTVRSRATASPSVSL